MLHVTFLGTSLGSCEASTRSCGEALQNHCDTTTAMATAEDTTSEPSLRFKRRKIAHPRRAQPHVPSEPGSASPNTGTHEDTNQAAHAHEDDESAPSLKEILRARKRPRDRLREATHRAEARSQALVHASAPQQDTYANRFVAQTGQVVDRDDKQM